MWTPYSRFMDSLELVLPWTQRFKTNKICDCLRLNFDAGEEPVNCISRLETPLTFFYQVGEQRRQCTCLKYSTVPQHLLNVSIVCYSHGHWDPLPEGLSYKMFQMHWFRATSYFCSGEIASLWQQQKDKE